MTNNISAFLEALNSGREAFHNGLPKIYPGITLDTDVSAYNGWHEGWAEAWKATTEGQIKLGVYS